jgi:polyisoprenoid-binding protein YceI
MTKKARQIWLIAGGIAVLMIAGAAFGVWWFVLRDDSPPPPDIDSQAEAIAEEQDLEASPTPTTTSAPTEEAADTTETVLPSTDSATDPEGADLTGTWIIDTSLGTFDDFTSSYAGYRVTEELANIGTNSAVGRTPDVSGQFEIEGTTIPSADVVVDMASLQSDSGRRDGRVRSTLEVDQFPTADFVLTTPIVLSSIPAEDEVVQIQADGDFTAHGVTQPVTVDLEARLVGEVIVVVGSFEISFADYEVTPPSAALVLSIEDVATVEWQLNLTRGS